MLFLKNGNFNVLDALRYYLVSPSNNSVKEATLPHIVEENDGERNREEIKEVAQASAVQEFWDQHKEVFGI